MQLDSQLVQLMNRLGWEQRRSSIPGETVIGDYARGYLLLQRENCIQVARRSSRGEPALKMWTPDAIAAQKYVTFCVARVVAYVESGVIASAPSPDLTMVSAPFEVDVSRHDGTFVTWGETPDAWAGFGVGNIHLATQFAQYAALPFEVLVARTIAGWST